MALGLAPKDRGRLASDQVEESSFAVGLRQGGETLLECRERAGSGGRRAMGTRADQTAEEGRQGVCSRAPKRVIEANWNQRRIGIEERGVEQAEALLRREGEHALPRHTREVCLAQMGGHHATLGPETPGE